MGEFIQTAIVQNIEEDKIKAAIDMISTYDSSINLIPEECRYIEQNEGVSVLFNDDCAGFEFLAEKLSQQLNRAVLFLYIYDEDFWGYMLYEKGKEIDSFNPIPGYFEDVDDSEIEKSSGDSSIISQYFDIEEDKINKYLVTWNEEDGTGEDDRAYSTDEYGYEAWQMYDFVKKLGFPYRW